MTTRATLQFISAIGAFAAALFWALSAIGPVPDMNFDTIAQLKPWLEGTAKLNRAAAMCAAVSAVTSGFSLLAAPFERWLDRNW
jgi:hypothetical protein